MSDYGSEYTDEKLEKMERKIRKIYTEAQKDIERKMAEHDKKFKIKDDIYQEKLNNGKISWAQYSAWLDGQIFQGEQWESKRDQIISVISKANTEASKIVNGGTISTFAENANWSHYDMETTCGVNFGFGLYDAHTVTNLIKNNPKLLPEWKIDEEKDYKWNKQKVTNSITQGIIQGEKLDEITTRLVNSLCANNRNTMLTFARTAMTGAQNAGRDQGLMDAKALGINVVKVWMATLDDHTRESHQKMDGEEQKVGDTWHPIKFSNGCRFPGDPSGPPHEVYNCRCTLVSDVKDYPSEFKRYDNIDGVPIDNMTYEEWKEAKEAVPVEPEIEDVYEKFGGEDAYNILSKYSDLEDLIDNAPYDEMDILEKAGLSDLLYDMDSTDEMEKLISDAHSMAYNNATQTESEDNTSTFDPMEWIESCKSNPTVSEMLDLEQTIFDNMPDDQQDALRLYTGSSYSVMNEYLRLIGSGMSLADAEDESGISESKLDAIRLCHDALNENRLDRDMVLRRGTDLGDLAGLFMQGNFYDNKSKLERMSIEDLNQMLQGQVGTYFGFTSTSSQWDKGFSGSVEMIIRAPKGTPAASIMTISRFGTHEGETLLRDNLTVVCHGVEKSDGHKRSAIRVFVEIVVDN